MKRNWEPRVSKQTGSFSSEGQHARLHKHRIHHMHRTWRKKHMHLVTSNYNPERVCSLDVTWLHSLPECLRGAFQKLWPKHYVEPGCARELPEFVSSEDDCTQSSGRRCFKNYISNLPCFGNCMLQRSRCETADDPNFFTYT